MATQLLPLKSGRMYDIMFMYDDEKIMKTLGYLRAIQKNNKVAHLFFKPDSETAPISFDDSKRKASIGEIQVEGDWYLGKYGELSQYASQEADYNGSSQENYNEGNENLSDYENLQEGGKKLRKSRKARKARKSRKSRKQKNTRRR